jgi:four helix bundle protein
MEGKIKPHKNLEVWKQGIELTKLVYKLAQQLPADEKFGLISQLKRAAVSIPLNIAEGAAKHTKKEFIHFLYISRGSSSEVDTLLVIVNELGFVNLESIKPLEELNDRINAMLNGLIKKLSS